MTHWRAQMSFSQIEAANALDLGEDVYGVFGTGLADLPVAIWRTSRKCQALLKGKPVETVPEMNLGFIDLSRLALSFSRMPSMTASSPISARSLSLD